MLDISFFRGSRPKIQPHLLEVGEAQKAINCRLTTGGLEAFRGETVIQAISLPSVSTIHKYGDTAFWFEFANDANAVEGPIASDTETTTYFTGDGEPAMTYASIATAGAQPYPANRYRLGLPAPDQAPTVAVGGTADPSDTTAESVAYVVTYVSARGEEGPPSNPSLIVDTYTGNFVSLTAIPTTPIGNYNVATKRIYRTATSSGTTEYLFVAEIPVAQTTYTDSKATTALGEALPSADWNQPPATMVGLTSLENGVLAGFDGKMLYLSEPYRPHAWPYSIAMDNPIVGIVGVRGGVIVATTGFPVIVSFTHPASASQTTLETTKGCVSKRSMVDMGDYSIYATGDGLIAVDGSGNAPLITTTVIDRYQWLRYSPSTIHAYRKENWYVAFYKGLDGDGGFAISATGDQFIEFDFYADAGFTDQDTGDLYLVINGNIVKWDDDPANLINYTWKSSVQLLPKPINIGAARVDAESYPVTFKLVDDGKEIYALQVTSNDPFWLPADVLTRRYHIELSGTATVRRVITAVSMGDLT